MRLLATIALVFALGCASVPRPDQTLLAMCGAYSLAAMRAADLAHAGVFTAEEILTLRHMDSKMFDACNAGVAMIEVGMDPSDATAIIVSLLPAFERYLIEQAGKRGENPVDNGVDALPLAPAPTSPVPTPSQP